MQFFYIDYMNGDRKERNVGFLRVERNGICVGLRGVPLQCGNKCSVYAVEDNGEKWCLGEVGIQNGYGMEKLGWGDVKGFEKCVRVEVPFYGYRKGVCVLRESSAVSQTVSYEQPIQQHLERDLQKASKEETEKETIYMPDNVSCDLPRKLPQDKWEQLVDTYPQVHIFPEAQSLLIKPKDLVVLTQRYHSLISNSFVLHSYYNYRQLLLLRFEDSQLANSKLRAANESGSSVEYYLGVPGVYYDREKRIAQMFGFEGFDIGEARMREEEKREIYEGCFGYYMKQVEI
ncbi:MAG: hypothetical protein K2P35_13525 [Lachnospiraceae bacterium]|nr:hypothetical protein [Lachnospiraceae bacterium]